MKLLGASLIIKVGILVWRKLGSIETCWIKYQFMGGFDFIWKK
jgi:hypothetical protein